MSFTRANFTSNLCGNISFAWKIFVIGLTIMKWEGVGDKVIINLYQKCPGYWPSQLGGASVNELVAKYVY